MKKKENKNKNEELASQNSGLIQLGCKQSARMVQDSVVTARAIEFPPCAKPQGGMLGAAWHKYCELEGRGFFL